ncbi:hypothetical protein UK15_38775 [Streptomyces variegatus]|uniref:Uncharacterized protein n=1 Tax=Streptomyces variegatus TaxID=284040 RepID=A0A0M2GF62_9ACTN|nr:hypothetical protein UK15_38775 [Streptomyces variegatus]
MAGSSGAPATTLRSAGAAWARRRPSRWRRPPSVFSCASCAASAARPPRGGVRPEACDGSRRRGGKGARAGHRVR